MGASREGGVRAGQSCPSTTEWHEGRGWGEDMGASRAGVLGLAQVRIAAVEQVGWQAGSTLFATVYQRHGPLICCYCPLPAQASGQQRGQQGGGRGRLVCLVGCEHRQSDQQPAAQCKVGQRHAHRRAGGRGAGAASCSALLAVPQASEAPSIIHPMPRPPPAGLLMRCWRCLRPAAPWLRGPWPRRC